MFFVLPLSLTPFIEIEQRMKGKGVQFDQKTMKIFYIKRSLCFVRSLAFFVNSFQIFSVYWKLYGKYNKKEAVFDKYLLTHTRLPLQNVLHELQCVSYEYRVESTQLHKKRKLQSFEKIFFFLSFSSVPVVHSFYFKVVNRSMLFFFKKHLPNTNQCIH